MSFSKMFILLRSPLLTSGCLALNGQVFNRQQLWAMLTELQALNLVIRAAVTRP